MTSYLKFLLKYSIFWYLFFLVQKLILFLYHYSIYSKFTFSELMGVITSGVTLDLSFIGYILLLPTLILSSASIIDPSLIKKFVRYYSIVVLVSLTFLFIIDLEILKWWGIRADKTILKYFFQVPKEILATSSVVPVYLLVFLFFAICFSSIFIYLKNIDKTKLEVIRNMKIVHSLLFIFLASTLIIPIRGGFQQIPINQSSAYFSYDNHLNLAAVNLPWNFANSFFSRSSNTQKPYKYQSVDNHNEIVKQLFARNSDQDKKRYLKTTRPNVLIIIWESFTYKAIEDPRNLTPGFNRIKENGIFFNNIYSTGDRSDKGITGVLSGYPGLPRFSIMNEPQKASKIPSIPKKLKKEGYFSSFYYGGEPDFANMKSYLLTSSFDNIVTKENFPEELQTSKWGVHDQFLFDKILEDLEHAKKPFFTAAFTLSSHEPYDVPTTYIKGEKNEEKFANSINYTDQCLESFIDKASEKPWWDSTIVVVIADHGHIFPGKNQWATRNRDEYHIPMLWTGGAIESNEVVSKLGSQTDLASSLLDQMNIDHTEYTFSKDIFSGKEFAYYAFNNGFGFIRPDEYFVFDNVGSRVMHKSSQLSNESFTIGKAYQEVTFRDYLDK